MVLGPTILPCKPCFAVLGILGLWYHLWNVGHDGDDYGIVNIRCLYLRTWFVERLFVTKVVLKRAGAGKRLSRKIE